MLFAGRCWTRRQLSNTVRYVSVASKLRKSLSSMVRVSLGLAELYSTANYSTTTGRTLILFAGGCWTRRQLSNAVRYVSVASKLRKSLSSVEGVSIVLLPVALADLYSMADNSTTA